MSLEQYIFSVIVVESEVMVSPHCQCAKSHEMVHLKNPVRQLSNVGSVYNPSTWEER